LVRTRVPGASLQSAILPGDALARPVIPPDARRGGPPAARATANRRRPASAGLRTGGVFGIPLPPSCGASRRAGAPGRSRV